MNMIGKLYTCVKYYNESHYNIYLICANKKFIKIQGQKHLVEDTDDHRHIFVQRQAAAMQLTSYVSPVFIPAL